MKIVLTGARGQLATDLSARLALRHEVVGLSHEELDIGDGAAVHAALNRERPEVLINTAAFHRVDDCEQEVERSFQVNAVAVLGLARWCAARQATLVHFSTDYVFSGRERTPRAETDLPGPLSVYAASKLAGEYLARQACERHVIVRTCGLYGHAGSRGKGGNFVEKMLALAAAGKPIHVVDDQELTPSYTADVAATVVELIETARYGLYHVTNAGSCTWYGFARKIFALSGMTVDLQPTSSKQFSAPARRPAYSVLRHAALEEMGHDDLPRWEEALRRYVEARRDAAGPEGLRA
jgi:dTDP-4-dehydrorhamnose reductase